MRLRFGHAILDDVNHSYNSKQNTEINFYYWWARKISVLSKWAIWRIRVINLADWILGTVIFLEKKKRIHFVIIFKSLLQHVCCFYSLYSCYGHICTLIRKHVSNWVDITCQPMYLYLKYKKIHFLSRLNKNLIFKFVFRWNEESDKPWTRKQKQKRKAICRIPING